MKKAFIGLSIAAVLLVCSCATREGRNTQKGADIEVTVGGAVSGQAVGSHTGARPIGATLLGRLLASARQNLTGSETIY